MNVMRDVYVKNVITNYMNVMPDVDMKYDNYAS
jgi:hypothetical protein